MSKIEIPIITTDETGQATRSALKNLKALETQEDRTAKAAEGMQKTSKAAGSSFKGMGAAAKTAAAGILTAGAAISKLAKDVADARNAINDMAARTGVSAKTLAGLKLAAEGSGRQFEDLNEVLNPLVARLGQVRAGSSTAEEGFAKMGVAIRDSNGVLLSNDEVLANVVGRLQSIEDPATRAQVAVNLLGESGGKLNQVLGDTALETYVDHAERFGIDVGPKASQSAQNLQRSLAEINMLVTDAKADFADFFSVAAKIDSVALGFVYAREAASAYADLVGDQVVLAGQILSEVWEGNLTAAVALSEGLKTSNEIGEETAARAEEAARAFWESRRAMEATGGAAEVAGEQIRTLSSAHASAAHSAKAEAKAAAEAKQAHEDFIAAGIEGVGAIAEAESLSVAERRAALALIRDDLHTEISVRAAAIEAIAELNAQARADEITAQEAHRAAQSAINLALWEERRTLREQEAEAKQRALEEDEQRAGEWQSTMIGAAQQALAAQLSAIGRKRSAEIEATQAAIDSQIRELEMKENLTEKEKERLDKLQDKKKRLAMADFRRTQGLQIAQAIINGALLAVTSSLPPPAGIGFPQGAISAAATTGAQIAVIAAQPPPRMHDGGAVDEYDRRLKAGEFVVNARGALGNEQALDGLNEGKSLMPDKLAVYIGGKYIGEFLIEEMRGDGEVGRAFRDPSPSVRGAFRG